VNLTAVSLFAGIEGIGLALHRAGIEVKAAVEIDDAARGVIADHFPDTTLLTDVTKVSADDLLAAGFVPERGLVAAGWPCQGNSVAGRRGGMADPRSGLWVHVARLLAELRPRWFLGENVPGLLSVNDGRDFATVVGDLAGLGYGFCWRVLDAQHFGVPQRRRRVFIVGCAGDRAAPVQVLLEPESRGGDTAPRPAAGTRVAGALMAGSDGRGWRIGADEAAAGHLVPVGALLANGGDKHFNDADAGRLIPTTAYALRADPGGTGQGHNTNYVTHALTAEGADASEDGTGRGTPLVSFAWQAGGKNDASGAFNDDGTTPTLPRSQTLAISDATAVRRLTPLECERLQGFPDQWTATSNGRPQSDSARYRQLGNAVAVPCVEWIARRIVTAASEVAQ
jgi:DNA (cytosine-5)-methyltransferase 1